MIFHHIGVACTDFARERKHFATLGYVASSPEYDDPLIAVKVQFLEGGGPRLELVCPLHSAQASPLASALNTGVKFYHLAYEVDDLERSIAQMQAQRCKLVAAPTPAVAFEGRRVAFLMQPTLNLIELIATKT